MKTLTAFFTTTAVVFAYLPATASAGTTDEVVQFVDHGAYTDEDGREIEFAVWVDDGELQADVVIHDPLADDLLELWLEGSDVVFEGISNGERFSGSAPVSDFDAGSDAPFCVGWIALVCAGALAILAASGSGCASGEGCAPRPKPDAPGGHGGVPTGGNDGDGGDGSDSDSGEGD